jgi:hypothetical protein
MPIDPLKHLWLPIVFVVRNPDKYPQSGFFLPCHCFPAHAGFTHSRMDLLSIPLRVKVIKRLRLSVEDLPGVVSVIGVDLRIESGLRLFERIKTTPEVMHPAERVMVLESPKPLHAAFVILPEESQALLNPGLLPRASPSTASSGNSI